MTSRLYDGTSLQFIVVLRFSPRLGSAPMICDFRNSNKVTVLLDGPSHNSAVRGLTRRRPTFGSLGPSHHILSVACQIDAATASSHTTLAEAVMERYAFSVESMNTRPISWS